MQHDATEVLVVGAGPVGMFAALTLAQNGVKVHIIDEGSRTAGRSYACALHPHTLELLSDVGVAKEAVELGRLVNSIGLYADGSRRAELKLPEMPWKFPFALVLEQAVLEDLLEQKLRRAGNVRVSWNHRLAGLETDGGGVTATIEKLALTAKGYGSLYVDVSVQKEMQARADYVIGADGRNSMVRRLLGVECERTGEPELYVVYEAACNRDCGHELKIFLDGKTASVMWPLSGEKCRWSFQLLPADDPEDFPGKDRSRFILKEQPGDEDSLHHLLRWLGQRAPWLAEAVSEVGWCTDIQFERRLAKEFGRERCWLAGDAAHQTSPVGMQSMNAGLREAGDLAHKLVRILRGKETPGLLEIYNAYHRGEWEWLLGLKGPPKARPGTPLWLSKSAPRILSSLPASGPELALLLDRLGLGN
jgi:NADPH-dependent dioxygenase